MNWAIKDENMKNMLWCERCRKDVRASRHQWDHMSWSVQPESLSKHILSPEVNIRDTRFLNGSTSLLASLSRYVSDTNATAQASFVRSFSAFRKEKTSRPPLRAHGHRAVSALPSRNSTVSATPTADEIGRPATAMAAQLPTEVAIIKPQVTECAEFRPPTSGACRPQTAIVRRPADENVTLAAKAVVENVAPQSYPSGGRVDIRRPLSAMMYRQNKSPKWQHPVTSSDVYGWQPSTVPHVWEDHRFQHPLSTTDVTKMGCMGSKAK